MKNMCLRLCEKVCAFLRVHLRFPMLSSRVSCAKNNPSKSSIQPPTSASQRFAPFVGVARFLCVFIGLPCRARVRLGLVLALVLALCLTKADKPLTGVVAFPASRGGWAHTTRASLPLRHPQLLCARASATRASSSTARNRAAAAYKQHLHE